MQNKEETVTEKRKFSFFPLNHQTFKSALPRTIAPFTAAKGLFIGAQAGANLALFCVAFASDSANEKNIKSIYALASFITVAGGMMGGLTGYVAGYGGTNLVMTAFPPLKDIQSRFLLEAGYKPQIKLFLSALILMGGSQCIKMAQSEFNSPQNRA